MMINGRVDEMCTRSVVVSAMGRGRRPQKQFFVLVKCGFESALELLFLLQGLPFGEHSCKLPLFTKCNCGHFDRHVHKSIHD